jgi:hypothetical protein
MIAFRANDGTCCPAWCSGESLIGGEPTMIYTAQVHLDAGDLATEISKVRGWLDNRHLDPNTFQYRVGGKYVRLRLDFSSLSHASAFAGAFGGMVLGVRDAGQAAD